MGIYQTMKRILVAVSLLLASFSVCAQFTPGTILSAAQLNNQFSLYVPIAGGTLTGPLTVPSISTTSPIALASGGTGANTANAALANLGGLPLTGGVLNGALTVPSLSTGPVTGSVTTSGLVSGVQVDNINTCTDTQGLTGTFQIKDCYKLLQSYGGSNVTGNRQAIEGYGLLTSPSAPGSVFRARYYVGGSFTMEAQTGDNGFATTLSAAAASGATSISVTSASGIVVGTTLNITLASAVNGSSVQQTNVTAVSGTTLTISPALTAAASNGATVAVTLGEIQGSITQAVTDSGASNLDVVTGHETNITVAAGTGPRIKIWQGIGNNSNDGDTGRQWDAALGVGSASSTIHAQTGILFSTWAGYFPVNSTGALIGAYSGAGSTTPINVADGLDATGINLTTAVVRAQVNSTSVAPSTANPGLAIQDNLTGGAAEIALVNTYQSAGTTFNVVQKTGASTSSTVLSVSPGGAVFSGVGGFGLPVLTVATLPTCNTASKGRLAAVSDATSPTYNSSLTGSGTVSVPVYCNGTSWTAH